MSVPKIPYNLMSVPQIVKRVAQSLGYSVEVKNIENLRKESEEHYYNPTYQGLIEIGVKPHYLTDEVMAGMFNIVDKFKTKKE